MPGPLCVISPGRLAIRSGRVQIDPKTVAGMQRYAASWPEEVAFVARRASRQDALLQPFDWPRVADLPFRVTVADDLASAVAAHRPAMTLAPLEPDCLDLLAGPYRCVWVSDFPLSVRWEGALADPALRQRDRARIGAGLVRRARAVRAAVRAAAGLQCNGPDAYATYAPHSARPLLFFDTRVGGRAIPSGPPTPRRPGQPLRLAFSGRWIAQKGVLDALQVLGSLERRRVTATMAVLGGGPLAQRLEADDAERLRIVGRLPFEDGWIPFVREHVDVMVLPHRQSDSASTFLESLACGAPVVAYESRYWTRFQAMHDGGWVVPRDVEEMADLLADLANQPDRVRAARERGLAFARRHTFEGEFERRIAHLQACA